ncbi:MAG: acyltransferase domain-containing protein [Gemmataceae bacterium]
MMTTTRTKPRPAPAERAAPPLWETEAFVLRGEDRGGLTVAARALDAYLEAHPATDLADLAFTLNRDVAPGGSRLGVVAKSVAELRSRLARAVEKLADPACEQVRDTSGIYWFARPLAEEGHVAFLFPGEGAQYPGMLRDVVAAFPEASAFLAEADAALAGVRQGEPPISQVFANGDTSVSLDRLDNAMLSVLIADGVLHRVLSRLGVEPAFAAGHSMGEMAALSAAGATSMDAGFLDRFGVTMKTLQRQEADADDDCVLLAVGAGRDALAGLLTDEPVYLAMDNCPRQTVLIGLSDVMARVESRLKERGLICERLSFRRPYHTPLFEPQLGPLRSCSPRRRSAGRALPGVLLHHGGAVPDDAGLMRDLAVRHWAAPSAVHRHGASDARRWRPDLRRGRAARQPLGVRRGHPARPGNSRRCRPTRRRPGLTQAQPPARPVGRATCR